jgi:hypothetical protein
MPPARGIDADDDGDVEAGSVRFVDAEGGLLHRLKIVIDAEDVEGGVGEILDLVVVGLVHEVAGQHAIPVSEVAHIVSAGAACTVQRQHHRIFFVRVIFQINRLE